MAHFLVFDTETTGLPINWKAPIEQLDNWPRLVQLAWEIVSDEDGAVISSADLLVKPEGFEIPAESTKIHRISHREALERGMSLRSALEQFNAAAQQVDGLVAHNIQFDRNILGAEYLRTGVPDIFPGANQLDTSEAGIHLCKLPGKNGLRPPRLQELYHFLFSEHFEEAHNAAADVHATAKCFLEMYEFGLFDD